MVERNAEVAPDKRIEWPRQALQAAREPLAPSGGREGASGLRKTRKPSRPSVARYGSVRSGSTAGFGQEANFLATESKSAPIE